MASGIDTRSPLRRNPSQPRLSSGKAWLRGYIECSYGNIVSKSVKKKILTFISLAVTGTNDTALRE